MHEAARFGGPLHFRPLAGRMPGPNVKIALRRRGARVAEGGALLRRYTGLNLYRGFESLPLRQNADRKRSLRAPFAFMGHRRNTNVKLFAGIPTVSSRRSPARSAAASTSSMSRTPHSGLRDFRLASNSALLGDVCRPPRRYGP